MVADYWEAMRQISASALSASRRFPTTTSASSFHARKCRSIRRRRLQTRTFLSLGAVPWGRASSSRTRQARSISLCTDTTGVPDAAHKPEIANFKACRRCGIGGWRWPCPDQCNVVIRRRRQRWAIGRGRDYPRIAARPLVAEGNCLVDAARVDIAGVQIYNAMAIRTCLSPAAIEMVRDNASNVTGFFMRSVLAGRCLNGVLTQKAAGLAPSRVPISAMAKS